MKTEAANRKVMKLKLFDLVEFWGPTSDVQRTTSMMRTLCVSQTNRGSSAGNPRGVRRHVADGVDGRAPVQRGRKQRTRHLESQVLEMSP
jgi:hypothetical protein